jgi:hypothetical protein
VAGDECFFMTGPEKRQCLRFLAVILAANWKDSVTGRTKILVVSIITRNGFSHSGAPSG